MNIQLLLSIATLCGTIIGVGTFGLPYVISKIGFWPGIFYLFLLGGIILILNLLYGETILRNKSSIRLPGLAKKYFNKKGETAILISTFFGNAASLICYLIAGGEFLSNIFNINFLISAILCWLLFSIGVIFGVKTVSNFELFMFALFIITLGVIFFVSSSYIKIENLSGFYPQNIFLPYGVILFAMSGTMALPTLREILNGKEKDFKKAIIIGTLISVIFYAIFAFIVVGVCGPETSEEAIQGLMNKIGSNVSIIGAIFGFLAVITSFFTIGVYLRDVLLYDFKINRWSASFFVCIVPLLGLYLGTKYLIPLMSFIGTIFGAFESVILLFISKKAKEKSDRKPEYEIRIPNFLLYLLCFLFIGGFFYEIISFLL